MQPRYYIKHIENIGLLRPKESIATDYALDLGCGSGGDSIYLKSRGYIVTSVDIEPYFDEAVVSDIRNYNIEKGKYSLIICNNVLPFIKNKDEVEKIIRNIIQGLKISGV